MIIVRLAQHLTNNKNIYKHYISISIRTNITKYQKINRAYTLVEIIISIFIVGVLASIALLAYGKFYKKTYTIICRANLKSLYGGAYGYVGDHNKWPQEPETYASKEELLKWWVDILKPYAVEYKHWQCPAHKDKLENDSETEESEEIEHFSYEPSKLDSRPTTPFKWTNHPWFIEIMSFHEDGSQYYITPDGSVKDFNENMIINK